MKIKFCIFLQSSVVALQSIELKLVKIQRFKKWLITLEGVIIISLVTIETREDENLKSIRERFLTKS